MKGWKKGFNKSYPLSFTRVLGGVVSEKVYMDEQGVFVSSSRIKVGNKNLVLRNIASVSVEKIWYPRLSLIGKVLIFLGLLFAYVIQSSTFLMIYLFLILPLGLLLMFIGSLNHFAIKIETSRSSLFPLYTLFSKDSTLPTLAVEKINEALGYLDSNPSPQVVSSNQQTKIDVNDASATLQKLREMVDSGLISEEDYEQKKKQIIGLI